MTDHDDDQYTAPSLDEFLARVNREHARQMERAARLRVRGVIALLAWIAFIVALEVWVW